jgi:hypothetical protein
MRAVVPAADWPFGGCLAQFSFADYKMKLRGENQKNETLIQEKNSVATPKLHPTGKLFPAFTPETVGLQL